LSVHAWQGLAIAVDGSLQSIPEGFRRMMLRRSSGIVKLLSKEMRGAQYHLGFIYANGLGVQEDEAQLVKWRRKAGAQRNTEACNELKDRGLRWD
jgi:TPR repeat protein